MDGSGARSTAATERGWWVPRIQGLGVAVFLGLAAVLAYRTLPALFGAEAAWLLVPAAAVAYLAADLGAGVVHWYCDTFFREDTPVVGPTIIRGFREHHRDPSGITRHSFAEVNGSNCWAMVPLLAWAVAAGGPSGASTWSLAGHAFLLLFALAIFATNQFHRWAHAERVPPGVRTLQRWGLILSPARHDVHHSGRHDRGYCVTTGWLNPLLDRLEVFARLERLARPGRARRHGA